MCQLNAYTRNLYAYEEKSRLRQENDEARRKKRNAQKENA
jgi:hypothetical protein